MPLITQKVQNLLGGVSRKPKIQRQATQAEEQINALTASAEGVRKRPPTRHVGQITTDLTGWDDAFVTVINRTEDERFHVVVSDGHLKIYDAVNGGEIDCLKPDGEGYLSDPDNKGFRAVTVGDTTFIVNRGVQVAQLSDKAPDAINEALVYVRQADFSTLYRITLDGTPVELRTVDMTDPTQRQFISTDAVAGDLLALLLADPTISASFTFTQLGSTIHIAKNTGEDFDLGVADGLGDNGLKAIKGSIQSFADLPARANNGIVVHVTGDVTTTLDDFYVQYDDLGSPDAPGVWRECPKPGTAIALDPATLPHRLSFRAADQPPGVGLKEKAHDGPPAIYMSNGLLNIPGTNGLGGNDPWQVLDDDGVTRAYQSYYLTFPNYAVETTVSAPAVGGGSGAAYAVVRYNMLSLSALPRTQTVSAVLKVNGTEVQRDTWTINADGTITLPTRVDAATPFGKGVGTVLLATNVSVDDVIDVIIEYGNTSSNFIAAGLAQLVASSPVYYGAVGRLVTMLPTFRNPGTGTTSSSLPIGAIVTFNYGAHVITHTIPDDAHSDPASVAAGLYAAIVAASISGLTPGYTGGNTYFDLVSSDDTYPDMPYSVTYPANTFHNDTLGLTPGILVGSNFKDITDGSIGVVTANTSRTITVDALTGGHDNTFQNGDLCGISPVFIDPTIGTHYVFDQVPWKTRQAGDTDVVTFPSFTNKRISDVFFYQNRLGLLCDENVFMSASGDLFELFRTTATQLLADDVIDVRSAHAEVTIFDAAFQWAGGLFVKSDNVWFAVTGEPALTPTTIRLDPVGAYPSSHDPRPVIAGRRGFYTRAKSSNTQVFEISLNGNNSGTTSADVTLEVPDYIKGFPVAMVGDDAEGFLALLTDDGGHRNVLYIYRWQYDDNGTKVISSWSKWQFPLTSRLLGLDMADGVLGFLRQELDAVYFEQLDLDPTPLQTEAVAYLDRRVESGLSPTFSGGHTVWTLPYTIAKDAITVDGNPYIVPQPTVVDRDSGTILTTDRTTDTTVRAVGDQTALSVYIGQRYTMYYKPTQLYMRGQAGVPETGGRLQIRYLTIFFKNTCEFVAKLTALGRAAKSYTFSSVDPVDGSSHLPAMTENEQLTIELTSDTPGPCCFSAIDWEGWFTNRAQRLG